MANQLNSFNFQFQVRRATLNGPVISEHWNDSVDEIANSLAALESEWNTKLVKIIEGLPNGSEDTGINAFINGLDGKNLWVDQDVTASSTDLTYYNTISSRPTTVKESLDDLYTYINAQITQVTEDFTDISGGLTTAQQARIGANVFNSADTSSPTSLDGKSEASRLNLIQIAKDLYDEGSYSLDGDGAANLTNFSIRDMVSALLTLHNGTWDSDVTLDHSAVTVTVAQTDIASSHPGTDTYTGTPTNTLQDLDRIRNAIKTIRGTTTWVTANTALYSGGADSLEDLLVSTAGTGTKTSTNPWGYSINDIPTIVTDFQAVANVLGQSVIGDQARHYTSTQIVTASANIQQAISALDLYTSNWTTLSGLVDTDLQPVADFTGQTSITDSTPQYPNTQIVTQGSNLQNAIGALDKFVYDYVTLSGESLSVLPLSGSPLSSAFTASINTSYRVATASGFNITLPTVIGNRGEFIEFKVQQSTMSGIITLYPQATQTIDGDVSFAIDTPRTAISLRADGISDWMII